MPDTVPVRADFERITDTILDLESDIGRLHEAVTALHALASSIIGLEDEAENTDADRESRLDDGRALSPRDALRCIVDVARTTRFLRGVHGAIVDLQKRFAGARINVLYAGCGPAAPLALPLTTRFSSEQIQLTLIDAHEFSVDSVQRLADVLGLGPWISTVWCGDAMSYTHPHGEALHLLVIETMQKALEHEPQVALTRKLAPFLTPGGILIPERVRLGACLADMGAEFVFEDPNTTNNCGPISPERRRFELGTLVELTREGLRVGINPRDGFESPEASTLTIPNEVAQLPDLMIRTTVDVFGDHRLDDYDSGISYPTLIQHFGQFRAGDQLEFAYEEGPTPGLRIRRAPTP